MEEVHERSHYRRSRNTDIPCAMFDGLLRALPGVHDLLVTVACELSFAGLAPAQGRQDHTPSPYASMPLVARPAASIASRSNVRDDAYAPHEEAGRARDKHAFPKNGRFILFAKAEIMLDMVGKSDGCAQLSSLGRRSAILFRQDASLSIGRFQLKHRRTRPACNASPIAAKNSSRDLSDFL